MDTFAEQDYNARMYFNKIYLVGLLLACAGASQAASTNIDLELSAWYDDNLSRAESGHDIFSDNLFDMGLKLTHSIVLTPNSGLRFRGGLRLAEHAEYTELNLISANIGASYRIQPVAGYTAPWIELGATLEGLSFRDSDIRDGRLLVTEAIVGKRFTDRIGGRAGIGWEKRWADDTQVFEWQHHRIFAMADYKLGLETTLYASLSRDFGDQVFTATPNLDFSEHAKAIANDPVFGARRAYRLGAISDALEMGVSMPLNSSNTLDVGVRRFHANADGDHTYDDTVLRASWLYRFR